MVWRLAELIHSKEGEITYLDVVVMYEESEKPNNIRGVGNSNEQTVIGVSNFKDKRSPVEILKEFSTAHGSPMSIRDNGRDHAYARYIQQYEATIPLAFVTYFGGLR